MQTVVHRVNNPKGGQSLAKGLAMLAAFSRDRRELAIREMSGIADVSRPTAYRLAKVLEGSGFLRFNADRNTYSVGSAAFSVGSAFLPTSFTEAVDSLLDRLRSETPHTIQLSVLDGDYMLMVGARESNNLARIVAHPGQKWSPHSSASGKAILASLSDSDVRSLVSRTGLPRRAAQTITNLDVLLAELDTVRRRGFATAYNEFADGACAVAVALDATRIGSRYSVTVSAPTGSIGPEEEERLAAIFRQAAVEFSSAIAHLL